MVMHNVKIVLQKMSTFTDLHGLSGISCDIFLSLDCVVWKSNHDGQFLMDLFMSAFILIQ